HLVVGVLRAGPLLGGRVVLLLVERVRDGRLYRLVVRGQRAILEARGYEQPAAAVAHHDERRLAVKRVHALGVLRPVRLIVGRLVLHVIGRVVAGPLALLGVPPDVLLALRPRLAFGIGRSAVVH